MFTWFSDLDHTLIYSHRTTFLSEKVLVELLMGKEQSYMTKRTYDFMRGIKFNFVPVTTRSIEQYQRLFVFEKDIRVKHALVCNGAILLDQGKIDEKWMDETRTIAQEGICDLTEIQKELSEYKIKNIEDILFYFKAEKPEEVAKAIRRRYESKKVYIGFDKRKVYVLPSEINKGNAIQRYCSRFGITKSASSGDGEIDISMLNATRISMAPSTLIRQITSNGKKYSMGDKQIISDDICERLRIIIEENKL